MSDITKWVRLSFLGCGVLAWVFLRQLADFIFDYFNFFTVQWVVSPSDIVGIAVGFFLFLFLVRSSKATKYLEECLAELMKVSWPKGKESVMSTGVVTILIGIATALVVVMDLLFSFGAEKLYQ